MSLTGVYRYDKAALRAAISVDPDFRWCLNSSCGSGQYHFGGVDEPAFTCYSCGHSHCVLCELPWHQGPCSELSEVALTSKGRSPWGLIARCLRGGASGSASPNASLSKYHPNYYRCEPLVVAPEGNIGSEYLDASLFWPNNTLSAAAGDKPSNAATSGGGSHRKRGKSGGKTVESRRRRYEAKSEAYMTEWTKPCPGCKRMFEKDDGCDHIVCKFPKTMTLPLFQAFGLTCSTGTMCDTAFCFACLVIYRPDRNEAPHQRSCPNYYELDPYYDADYVEYQAGFEGLEEGDLDLLFQ